MAMRISFNLAADKLKLPAGASLQDLIRLLSVQGALRGAVRRISPSSVFIAIQLEGRQTEVEIPLQGQALTPGQAVEISLEDEERIVLKVLTPAGQGVELDKPKPIEQVLTELNIPPTEEAVLTARGLAERGFPVQEPLVWSILPWAEAGWLEEALLALEAKFPLKLEVLTMIRQLRSGNVRDPVLQDARENIPPIFTCCCKGRVWRGAAAGETGFQRARFLRPSLACWWKNALWQACSNKAPMCLQCPFCGRRIFMPPGSGSQGRTATPEAKKRTRLAASV